MKHTVKIISLLAAVAFFAACDKPELPVNGDEDNTPKERVIIYDVNGNENRQTLETEAEWDALLDQLCDRALGGNEVTFYNINQTTYLQGTAKGITKDNRTISTRNRDEIKLWMKEMERQGHTVRITFDEGSGTWHGEAYATAPASSTEGEIIGTWQLDCMVVTQVDADGHLLGSDLYEPEYGGGTMYYTFADNGTVTMTMHGMDGTIATENSTWSLSADGVLCSDLMPNGECWNVNWITSNTMIISRSDIAMDGNYLYQLQFEAVNDAE